MDTMAALADPVRRAILELLHVQPLTAGEIARHFPMSRPAVSRHLRVLREAGLVSVGLSGRTRVYRIEPGPLAEVGAWLAQFRERWSSRFDALETEVHRTRRERERRERAASESRVAGGVPTDITGDDDTQEQPA